MFKGIPRTLPVVDDITNQGTTKEEHDIDILETCEVVLKIGLCFNPVVCNIKQSKVMYFGNIICSKGVKPDPHKLLAISQL